MSIDKKQLAYTPITEDDAPPAYSTDTSTRLNTGATLLQSSGYLPTAQMQVGGSRNSKSLDVGLDGKRSFNHGLCSWYEEPGTTLMALCCPCVLFSTNHSRLVHLAAKGEPSPAPQRVGLWCCAYTLGPQLFGVGQIMLQCFSRLQTRQRYGIRGDVVQDALVASFCVPCSLVQEAREIDDEENALREGGQAPEVFFRDEEDAVEVAQAA